jgi:membrane-bound metal-dependent hydrolase YbcI (DUF457 family)
MFAIGHFALGYLAGKGTSKLAHVKINLPLLLAVSVIPDLDLLFRGFMGHRGLTHSIIVISVLMIPFFMRYKKAALPYLAAVLSHVFIGDFFSGGIEFLWPISKMTFGFGSASSSYVAVTELLLFFVSLALMFKLNDIWAFFKPQKHNLFLIICLGSILGPILMLALGNLNAISLLLVIPSLIWTAIFSVSLLIDFNFKFIKNLKK